MPRAARSRDGAIPIEVKLGADSENLLFTLPDFGPLRVIQMCVVDENAEPNGRAELRSIMDRMRIAAEARG